MIFCSVKYVHVLVIFNCKSSIQNSQFFIYSLSSDVFRFLLIDFFHTIIILSDFLTLSWFELCWSVCASLGSLALRSGLHGPPGCLPAALRPALLPLLGKAPAVLLQVKILMSEWQNAVLFTSPHFCAWVLNITIRELSGSEVVVKVMEWQFTIACDLLHQIIGMDAITPIMVV